jgi:hypothetical protein
MANTQEQLDNYVTYGFDGPKLDRDVPPNKIPFGHQSQVAGVDGAIGGCLRKYYGNRLVVDLAAISGLSVLHTYDGVSFLQRVTFQKRGTSTVYRGFVIRFDAVDDTDNEEVGLAYTANGGSTWAYLTVWNGSSTGITDTTAMECATEGAYLVIAVEGKATRTVYWDGSALVAVDSGPGAFSAILGALTLASQGADTSYYLSGQGVYQVRWRFYSSTRGIYSAMSSPVTVYGSGAATDKQWKMLLDFPANGAVVSGKVYADFAALFDTIDVFRSIDLGKISAAQQYAIFYHEQSIAKATSWATSGAFDALQVTIGTMPDTALVVLPQYDPSTDTLVAPPQSGAIARYQGMTLMGQALTSDYPYDILASSLDHTSPEYFTSYNQRRGTSERGRPSRFLVAGDSCFALHPGGFTHIYKASGVRPVQFVDTINGPGLDGKWAAQIIGNSILMISSGKLRQMGGNDGNIVDIGGVDRLMADDWAADAENYISGGYDGQMNCSFFLNANRAEMLCLWHCTGGMSMLEGANFRWATSGPGITAGGRHRLFCVTARGRVVAPDYDESGSGTMLDLSDSYTLAGSATGGDDDSLVSTGATFHADMIGAMLYMIDGDNAGEGRAIASVNVGAATLSLETPFDYAIANGDRFAISATPFRVALAAVRTMNEPEPLISFDRAKMLGASIKFGRITGLQAGVTDTLRVSAYRNAEDAPIDESCEVKVSTTIADASGAFDHAIDGIDILPYLEYIGVGSSFEITDVQVLKPDIDSKAVA